MKPKRKRTVREMAQDHARAWETWAIHAELIEAFEAGYRRGFRAGKAKAMRDCGWGDK